MTQAEYKSIVNDIINGDATYLRDFSPEDDKDTFELAMMEAGFTGLYDDESAFDKLYYEGDRNDLLSRLNEDVDNTNYKTGIADDTVTWSIGYKDGTIKYLSHDDNGSFTSSKFTDNQSGATRRRIADSLIEKSKIDWIIRSDGYAPSKYWANGSEGLKKLKKYGKFESWNKGRGEKRRNYVQDDWV